MDLRRRAIYLSRMIESPTVVLDTNVLEAAFRSRRGASFAVLSLVGRGRAAVKIRNPKSEIRKKAEIRRPKTKVSRLKFKVQGFRAPRPFA